MASEEDSSSSSSEARAELGNRRKSKSSLRARRPNWLPDGWIMDVELDEDGNKRKYYISPVSGCKFQSKREVLHHLKVAYFDDPIYGNTSFPEQSMQTVISQEQNSAEWLPREWILEIKTRLSGEEAGQNYKCYYDPFTGFRFYSKAEVLRFLRSGKFYYTPTGEEKERFKASAKDDVVALIEYSPDGLPIGWTKETVIRKSKDNNRTRRDPYYTDPVSGYIFRSIKDATRYIETKELGKYACGPRNRSIREIYSLGSESPPPIPLQELKSLPTSTRRCLFAEEASPSNGAIVIEIDDSDEEQLPPSSLGKLQLQPPDHTPSRNSLKTASTSSPYIDQTDNMADKKGREVSEVATDNSLDNPDHGKQKRKRGRPSKRTNKPTLHSEESEKKGSEEKELLKPEPTNDTTLVSQKRKHPRTGKEVSLLRRSSKRLAGLDPAPASELVIRRPSRRQQSLILDEPLLAEAPVKMELAEEATGNTAEDKASPAPALPSVDHSGSATTSSD